MKNIVEIKNLCYSVSESAVFTKPTEKFILENISFSVQQGKIVGVAGESGSGKTTLAKIIAGILPPTSGTITFDLSDEWKNTTTKPVQILFQNSTDILNPLRNIDDILDEAIETRYRKNDMELKKNILEAVKVPEKLSHKKGFELSGGEQQRIALARILAVKPEILILDEPFSAQDPPSQLNLLNLLGAINKEYHITMLCISHNLKILRELCDEIIIIYKGKIVESGYVRDVLVNPKNAYTKFLLKAENYSLSYNEIQNELEDLRIE
ncbi:MAG: ATP-binding cassette domain-containing protein [Ignavibacteriaceae bacterium]|nr:ATP-binding cassette domain-containing protein [Ignavibacteriaceae bacterium]